MNTSTIFLNLSIIGLFLFTVSCGSDDDGVENSGINAQNLVVNFDENPAVGASIGAIEAVSNNTLSFSISSQIPSGALKINPSTGELSVANASLFDFETNPVIIATISIIDLNNTTSAQAAINLNNLDDIASFLSTSEAAYTAAEDGDWVAITASEYIALASSLNEVSKVGTTDDEYNGTTITASAKSLSWVVSNVTTANIPKNSYVFAFKYLAKSVTDNSTSKVKQSSVSIDNGYADLGGALPTHSGTDVDVYFVLKGNNTMTTSTGYLAFYKAPNQSMGLEKVGSFYYVDGDGDMNSDLELVDDRRFIYQGLSTTQKQW